MSEAQAEVLYSPDGGAGFYGCLGQLANGLETLLEAERVGYCAGLPEIAGQENVTADLRNRMQDLATAWRAAVDLRFPEKYPDAAGIARSLPIGPALRRFFEQLLPYIEMLRQDAVPEAACMMVALESVFAGEAYVAHNCDIIAGLRPDTLIYTATERDGRPAWLEAVTIAGASFLAEGGPPCPRVVADCFADLQRAEASFVALRTWPHGGDAQPEFLPAVPIVERLAAAYRQGGCTALPGAGPTFWVDLLMCARTRDAAAQIVLEGRARVTKRGDVVTL